MDLSGPEQRLSEGEARGARLREEPGSASGLGEPDGVGEPGSSRRAGFLIIVIGALLIAASAVPTAVGATVTSPPGGEALRGSGGEDWMRGLSGDEVVFGGADDDELYGGPGRDVLLGGSGDDFIEASDGEQDVVNCGPGTGDVANTDEGDRVTASCETIYGG